MASPSNVIDGSDTDCARASYSSRAVVLRIAIDGAYGRLLRRARRAVGQEPRAAVAAQVRHHHPKARRRKLRRDVRVGVDVIGPAMKEHGHGPLRGRCRHSRRSKALHRPAARVQRRHVHRWRPVIGPGAPASATSAPVTATIERNARRVACMFTQLQSEEGKGRLSRRRGGDEGFAVKGACACGPTEIAYQASSTTESEAPSLRPTSSANTSMPSRQPRFTRHSAGSLRVWWKG